jgi:hypothetical protein
MRVPCCANCNLAVAVLLKNIDLNFNKGGANCTGACAWMEAEISIVQVKNISVDKWLVGICKWFVKARTMAARWFVVARTMAAIRQKNK